MDANEIKVENASGVTVSSIDRLKRLNLIGISHEIGPIPYRPIHSPLTRLTLLS